MSQPTGKPKAKTNAFFTAAQAAQQPPRIAPPAEEEEVEKPPARHTPIAREPAPRIETTAHERRERRIPKETKPVPSAGLLGKVELLTPSADTKVSFPLYVTDTLDRKVDRLRDECRDRTGLRINRQDVIRLLLNHATIDDLLGE